jgi:hypothetical protein
VKVLKGKKNKLTKSKHPVWTWDGICEALTAYKEQHGDCEVPQRYNEDLGLGAWWANKGKERKS